MASWSAENATKAYLQALKMGKKWKEPSSVEFLAALAAGNNSQLMVMAWGCGGSATAAALVCASGQTGGHVVCICSHLNEVAAARESVGQKGDSIKFVVGNVWELLCGDYLNADFVLVDCRLGGGRERAVFPVGRGRGGGGGGGDVVVVGYNASCGGLRWWWSGSLGVRFLPIGGGLAVGGVRGNDYAEEEEEKKKRGWVFEVDEVTGEEHFYKITSPRIR